MLVAAAAAAAHYGNNAAAQQQMNGDRQHSGQHSGQHNEQHNGQHGGNGQNDEYLRYAVFRLSFVRSFCPLLACLRWGGLDFALLLFEWSGLCSSLV